MAQRASDCSFAKKQARHGCHDEQKRSHREHRVVHIIAIGRLRTDPKTKAYVAKRIAEGHSKLDAIRALKRYLAREVFTLIAKRLREINQARIAA